LGFPGIFPETEPFRPRPRPSGGERNCFSLFIFRSVAGVAELNRRHVAYEANRKCIQKHAKTNGFPALFYRLAFVASRANHWKKPLGIAKIAVISWNNVEASFKGLLFAVKNQHVAGFATGKKRHKPRCEARACVEGVCTAYNVIQS
jgi:hypothetical protein